MKTIDLRGVINISFSDQRGEIEVTTLQEPDPAWHFTDAKGHKHSWKGHQLLTLRHVVDEWAVDEYDGERYVARSHYECRRCKEVVNPGYRTPSGRTYVPGLPRWEVTLEVAQDDERWIDLRDALMSMERCMFVLLENQSVPGYVVSLSHETGSSTMKVTVRG